MNRGELRSNGGWHSLHFYSNADVYTAAFDRQMNDFLEQFRAIVSCTSHFQAFFVRYRDPNPHLRFRLRSAFDDYADDSVEGVVAALIEKAPRCDLRGVPRPYERELDRYGGKGLIDLCEEFFVSSSDYAQGCLGDLVQNYDARWALVSLSQICYAVNAKLTMRDAGSFLSRHAHGYRQGFSVADREAIDVRAARINETVGSEIMDICLRAQREGCSGDSCLDEFITAVRRFDRALGETELTTESVRNRIGHSQLHMTANRLGVSIRDEASCAMAASEMLRAASGLIQAQ